MIQSVVAAPAAMMHIGKESGTAAAGTRGQVREVAAAAFNAHTRTLAVGGARVLNRSRTNVLIASARLLNPPGVAEVRAVRNRTSRERSSQSGAPHASSSHASALLLDQPRSQPSLQQSVEFTRSRARRIDVGLERLEWSAPRRCRGAPARGICCCVRYRTSVRSMLVGALFILSCPSRRMRPCEPVFDGRRTGLGGLAVVAVAIGSL